MINLGFWIRTSSQQQHPRRNPPYLAPYFAAKAGMDALAVSYGGELARWNIETTIVVPGSKAIIKVVDMPFGKLTLQFYTHAVSRDRMVAAGKMLTAILSHAPGKNGLRAD